jgi:pre-mRNA-splicing factor 18
MAQIVHYMQKREYQKANDAYLRLSIGNAPWPIGVTMVGCAHRQLYHICIFCLMVLIFYPHSSIHERSAREKISSDQVAHVLNDEVSRKYIQSLKRWAQLILTVFLAIFYICYRLLTFSQTKYPPDDISQLMG